MSDPDTRFIGYQEKQEWWERFTIAVTKKGLTKTEALRRLVRGWTQEVENKERKEQP